MPWLVACCLTVVVLWLKLASNLVQRVVTTFCFDYLNIRSRNNFCVGGYRSNIGIIHSIWFSYSLQQRWLYTFLCLIIVACVSARIIHCAIWEMPQDVVGSVLNWSTKPRSLHGSWPAPNASVYVPCNSTHLMNPLSVVCHVDIGMVIWSSFI